MKEIFNEYGLLILDIIGGIVGLSLLYATFIGSDSLISSFIKLLLEGLT